MSFKVISTFSGGGGSSLGYKLAGGKVLACNEFIDEAVKTYRLNFPDTNVIHNDIRKLTGKDFLNAAQLKIGELDIFDGSPPCASFSSAGAGNKGWGKVRKYSDKSQVVDDLFFEYLRIANEIKPKVIIAENVKGLTMGRARGYLKQIVEIIRTMGYKENLRVLNAANYGVPQSRERLIIVAVRGDIDKNYAYPTPSKVKTIKNLLPHIISTKMTGKPENWSRHTNRPAGTITQHLPSRTGYLSEAYVKTDKGEIRPWTINELKILQGLPEDFQVTGSFKKKWERIGRMVPPPLMKAVALSVQEHILNV